MPPRSPRGTAPALAAVRITGISADLRLCPMVCGRRSGATLCISAGESVSIVWTPQ